MTKKLYVGNLSYNVTDDALRELFSSVGEVTSVNVITDRMTGRSRGFGFVEMAESEAANQAINQLNGRMLEGREIKVAEARPQRPRGFRDDRRRGGGGGRRRY
jgi:cold-inducible RNA-binding protein